jgi:5'-deoxynucleotidase YfbR-like HD superfamily hydrolase
MRYTNGQHTHDVVSLIIQTWREAHGGQLPRAELIVAAHVHDAGEIVTGDVPSPIKDLLGAALHAVDANVERWLGCHPELTDEERLYLEAADRFELWLWCHEELSRGNTTVRDWMLSYGHRFHNNPLPWPFMELRDEVDAAGGVEQLTRPELQQAGGLA